MTYRNVIVEGTLRAYIQYNDGEADVVFASRKLVSIFACIGAVPTMTVSAEPVGKITGVGGVFFKSNDPKSLMAWYHDVLGLNVEAWGGAMLPYNAPKHPPALTLNVFKAGTDYLEPSNREFMLNFAVDDLDSFLTRLKAKGVRVLKQDDSDPSGRFAWILDPDGTKIELWQPPTKPTAK